MWNLRLQSARGDLCSSVVPNKHIAIMELINLLRFYNARNATVIYCELITRQTVYDSHSYIFFKISRVLVMLK